MKISPYVIAIVSFIGILYFIELNKEQSQEMNNEISEKHALAIKASNTIDSINEASKIEIETMDLIIELTDDYEKHKKIGAKLSDKEISNFEGKMGFNIPYSYKLFLKYFGDGAHSVYKNSISKISQFSWLSEYQKELNEKIEIINDKEVNTDSLLCLMAIDSNGGTWCWLTSEKNKNGERPLVYYNSQDKKLHHKIPNFTDWLKLLVKNKSDVINSLNIDHKKFG